MQVADLLKRRSVSPKRLAEPGPTMAQVAMLVAAAGAAPDHGGLQPWRFILIRNEARADLAELFAVAAAETQDGPTPEQLERAREKAHNGACLIAVVARLREDMASIPVHEQWVSVGASVQNMLLAAQALGFAGMLVSGQKVTSPSLIAGLGLGAGERLLGFLTLGTATKTPKVRSRPDASRLLTIWPGNSGEDLS